VRICIVQPSLDSTTETFIRAHADHLPGEITVVHHNGTLIPHVGKSAVLSQSLACRAWRKAWRIVRGQSWPYEVVEGYQAALRRYRPQVVLAQYGQTGVAVLDACRRSGVPLVVHFHGFDASSNRVLERFGGPYRRMFREAAASIGVSRAMCRRLVQLGCPPEKVLYCPYGINCDRFRGATPEHSKPVFVTVGRMVEKKAPQLTLLAFARVAAELADARLEMIGEGPLLDACRDLAVGLKIDHAVRFFGSQDHNTVGRKLQGARAFVQHSVTAQSGDSEGTPVAVLEASASGLPVVATRHAGIPDVIEDGGTGLLVDERDVDGMAKHLLTLANDPLLAGELGRRGAARVRQYFGMEQSIDRLARVLHTAANREPMKLLREEVNSELCQPPASPEVPLDAKGLVSA
jgi:colanic acid/amylovoran biosynthesis glycosyltransferase